jgi:hypothetical protein
LLSTKFLSKVLEEVDDGPEAIGLSIVGDSLSIKVEVEGGNGNVEFVLAAEVTLGKDGHGVAC